MENRTSPDWEWIRQYSLETVRLIHEMGKLNDVPNPLYQFLDDVDVRQKSHQYARWQRDKVSEALNALSPGSR
jgi:hypothetical protein